MTRMLNGSLFKPDIVVVTRDVAQDVVADANIYEEDDTLQTFPVSFLISSMSFSRDGPVSEVVNNSTQLTSPHTSCKELLVSPTVRLDFSQPEVMTHVVVFEQCHQSS